MKKLIIILLVVVLSVGCDKSYSVTIRTEESSVVLSNIAKGSLIKSLQIPEKPGYTFLYWQYKGEKIEDTAKIKNKMILTPIYEKNIDINKRYEVTFDSDGGSSVEAQVLKPLEKVIKPEDPVKNGYMFVGWTLNGNIYNFDSKVVESITLKAKWEKVNVSKIYTITFKSSGSSVPTQKVKDNETVKKPSNPTKKGYTFKGWYYNNKPFDFSTKIHKDITLTAVWTKNS